MEAKRGRKERRPRGGNPLNPKECPHLGADIEHEPSDPEHGIQGGYRVRCPQCAYQPPILADTARGAVRVFEHGISKMKMWRGVPV